MVWRLVLLFAALAAAQYPTPTKYDFTILGCYKDDANRDLPTLGFSSSDNPTGISTSFGVSLSFCARVCQMRNFRYAGAQAGGECWCGNSYGSKGNATNCDTACSGDSSEKCGGPWANTVMDLSTVAGTICPPGYPESGALCCPERASFKLIDQALLNFLKELFPEKDFSIDSTGGLTQAQLAQRQAYLSSSVSPNIFFVTEGNFTITILADGAGNRNQVGYFLINQNGAILNTYQDIFGEASLTSKKGASKFSWQRCVEVGLSATRGPFPPGTGIGFFVHSDGANSKTLSDSCRNKQSIRDCLRQKGPRDYTCYSNENGCSIGASNTPLHGLNTFSSIDSLNGDGFRHVAIIDTQYGLILGFEDLWNIGDQDYNDVMFLISTTGEVTGNFPKLCDPACNSINGKCDYSTGTCQCDSAPGVTLDAQCNCQGACTGCTSGGTCRCSDKTCICKAGFESSPNGNDCACSRDPGRCTGVPGSFSCGQCNCNAGYGSPVANGLIGGIYNIKFGTSQVSVAANYFLDYGVSRNIVDSSDFGLYGWNTDHTGQALRYNGDEINGSTMKLKQNAVWSMRLQPNTNYDVTVTFGSQQGSSHSLNVNSNKLIESKQLGVNEYMSYTTRVNTGASGLIQLREPNKGADLTRITSVTIAIPPCSCVACSGGCGPGVCDCYTGKCRCPTGFSGASCQNCASGFWGNDCKPCTCVHGTCSQGKSGTGTCTCATGWTGANCDTCAAGFWGKDCAPCPSCVPGQGSCSQGPSGTGNCVCQPGFAGNLCQNCAENHGGRDCVQCPANCGNGTCSTGIAGTGQCVCNPGWAGAACSTCASGYYSSECKQCPTCNGHGTCNQGFNGDGLCTCATGWTGDNCESCASGFVASGANCAPCDPTCATCSGTGSNQCQTCASGLLYNSGSCVANCPPGKYRSGDQCLACDPSCKTCFGGDSNQCQTCEPPKLLENGVCVSTCASSNFVQGTSCSPCSQSCATCSGTASNCTSCSGSRNLHNGQCVDNCPTDHYASNNECRPCEPTCATCSGPGPSSCATCPPGKVFLSGQCISTCPAGYFEESGICKACRHPCDECTETATKCTTCKTGYLFSEVFNTCTENCTLREYPIDNTECGACDGSCLSCSGPSDSECTSCDEGLVLQNGVCKESCDPGFFLTGTDCLPCSSSCATCVDTSSKCTSCTGNLALSGNTCVNNCPPGTWKNGNNCDSCVGCLTCNGGTSNNCLSCQEAEALQGTTCQPDCDNKHFEQDNVCYPCHQTCQSCSGTSSSSCLTCIDGLVLDGTQCLNQCPPGKFDNAGVCETCDENCATCTGSATTCQTCPEDGVPYLQGTTCVGECEPDQFISSGRCTDCPSSCATCSGSSPQDCLSCTGSLYLREDGTCAPTCPSSQYANGATNTCDDCDDSCLTCSGPDQDDCLSCAETVLDESTCRPECPPGKYRNPATNTCEECFFTCATCSSGQSNDCDTCEDPRSLHQGTCIENCPAGFFSKDNRCEECDDNCATCVTSATTCVSCPEDTYMLNGQCYSPCPEGYYGADSMECVECLPTRECQNGGRSVCETGLCNCTGTGYSGPFCDCSEAPCEDNCNGVGLCTCGVCQCDPQINWGERCECQQCPGTLPCSEKGTCNCDGTCTCEDGFVGSDCSVACIYDECGVCFGNGNTCSGCDGVPNSGKTFDACGQCGGDNSTCAGCDGVPNSKARYDRCGVCNGTGSTCIEDLMCGERTSCATCTITFGQQEIRLCSWCNTTGTCIAVDKEPTCPEVIADCNPEEPTPASTDDLQNNGKGTSTGAIVGAVLGVVVAAAVIAALIYLAKMGKGPLYFESENFDDGAAAYNNPLYEEYSPQQENPLYVPPK